ncbi:hypothetical protein ACERIM_10715 [Natrinema sp. H-ect1]|uniref:hypothetical protein n=1 Tax=Natrinema sp. H-ect1 TaxID=3242700 RepID=UPI00359E76DE
MKVNLPMAVSEILLSGLATLFATLVGVWIAFQLDRKSENVKKKKRAFQHLKAVQKELEQNESIGWNTHSLIREMQELDEPEADHYAPQLFMTDAWDAAIGDQLIDIIPASLYYELQELYQETKSTNELIRRLRIEAIDPRLGDIIQDGSWKFKNWTYSVYYYDQNRDEVEHLGLGPLILRHCRDIAGDASSLQQELDEVISELEKELTENGEEQAGNGLD